MVGGDRVTGTRLPGGAVLVDAGQGVWSGVRLAPGECVVEVPDGPVEHPGVRTPWGDPGKRLRSSLAGRYGPV